MLIYEEAGGKVTDLEGKPIDFSRGRKMSGMCSSEVVTGFVDTIDRELWACVCAIECSCRSLPDHSKSLGSIWDNTMG